MSVSGLRIRAFFSAVCPARRSRRPAGWRALLWAGLCLLTASSAGGEERLEDKLIVTWSSFRIKGDKAALLVAPGSSHVLSFASRERGCHLRLVSAEGLAAEIQGGGLSFRAPSKSGNYWLVVRVKFSCSGEEEDATSRIAVLVGFPSSLLQDGFLNGFELGRYPEPADKNSASYRPPAYFYYLDYAVMGCWITEHIRLGDLGYDGRAPLPQYFALNLELPKKLEILRHELELRGLPCRFHFIGGGFISPKSNQVRTSTNSAAAELSRHMFGEAVDFIIDEDPRDQIMDDMNRDHVIDVRDCFVVCDLVTRLEQSGGVRPGGFGVYSPPRHQMLQMHIDVRGVARRWGYKEYNPNELSNVPPKKSLRPGG